MLCTKRDPNCMSCPLRNSCEYARNNGRCMKSPPRQQHSSPSQAVSSQTVADIEDSTISHKLMHTQAAQPSLAAAAELDLHLKQGSAKLRHRELPQLQGPAVEVERVAVEGQELQRLHDAHLSAEPCASASTLPAR